MRGANDIRLPRLAREIEESVALYQQRQALVPAVSYPDDLPVVQRKQEIVQAIQQNQVIILCGQTGSGKTTQLPKICLELGRGVAGMIGHTQPRRLAARSVAARIAQELNSPLGQAVGYQVRFSDKLSDNTCIKLMTDGILLAQTQHDRFLEQYDTLIIDEAHERSLNIDFLLGYLKRILPRRPDLKLIITSATIDPERFSQHFNNAPIVLVEGQTHPVETRYRPVVVEEETDEDEPTLQEGILSAVDELCAQGPGDILVFLSGEREIRQLAEALRQRPGHNHAEVLPLYARLSYQEQAKIFQPSARRRIVLATNVAETSLTIPNIRYVVDPGYARILRHAARSGVHRLPIEPISQASADQRQGRCGRVAEGICIRLYSQQDYESRPRYTDPEIVRTSLASVILRMLALQLGRLEEFPFIDPPDYRQIRDGYATLHELGAIDERNELTELGRQLAKLPVDPRIGRVIAEGARENVLDDVLVLAGVLSLPDPRERPLEQAAAADSAHKQYHDESSDFLAFLHLWKAYHQQHDHLSSSQLRKWCQKQFISIVRMREWHDIHGQLRELVNDIEIAPATATGGNRHQVKSADRRGGQGQDPAGTRHLRARRLHSGSSIDGAATQRRPIHPLRHDAIHRALLAGLLTNIGTKTDRFEYTGTRNTRFHLFPGSGLFASKPQWVVAAELVETSRLYARTVARIRPEWAERIGEHLVKRSWSEAHWNRQTAHVNAFEKVMLFGLVLTPRRSVHYGPIDPVRSREIFIQSALVEGQYDTTAPYFRHNQKLIDDINTLEAKKRHRDIMVDIKVRYDFYDARIPAGIHNGPAFEKWRSAAEAGNHKLLYMSARDLMAQDAAGISAELYPDVLSNNGVTVPLSYHFEPGHQADGVTARLPLAGLNQLSSERFEWLVPGLLKEKLTALIKSLPKPLRVNFVPAPQWAEKAWVKLEAGNSSLYEALAFFLSRSSGLTVRAGDFDPGTLLDHLHMNFVVVDDNGRELAWSRSLIDLRKCFGLAAREEFAKSPPQEGKYDRQGITRWDFDDLPESVEVKRHGMTLRGYPALEDRQDSVALRLVDTAASAQQLSRSGLRRLFMLQTRQELTYLQRNITGIQTICLHYAMIGSGDELKQQIVTAAADRALWGHGPSADAVGVVRRRDEFAQLAELAWRRLNGCAGEVAEVARQVLGVYHTITLMLQKPTAPLLQASIEDMKQDLSRLVPKDFLLSVPPAWMIHLPRFMKAVEVRLKKLNNAGLQRDQRAMQTIAPLQKRYEEQVEKNRKRQVFDPVLETYRWWLQELRVSLFAQELRTSLTVSPKRLDELWLQVK